MSINIFGAGLAGLLTANILRAMSPVLHEKAADLPNNHNALLRFRGNSVADATGVSFKKVVVQKSVSFEGKLLNDVTLKHNNLYSYKVTDEYLNRSILNLKPSERWIAPENFIQIMENSVKNIKYSSDIIDHCLNDAIENNPIISTIPMPILLKLLNEIGVPILDMSEIDKTFKYKFISVFTADINEINCDLYQTIYYPGQEYWYRASITGKHFIVEFANDCAYNFNRDENRRYSILSDMFSILKNDFGINVRDLSQVKMSIQQYGKIVPIEEGLRRKIITELTDKFNIYSIGRFATWRQILLDDVVNDIKVVQRLINGCNYNLKLWR